MTLPFLSFCALSVFLSHTPFSPELLLLQSAFTGPRREKNALGKAQKRPQGTTGLKEKRCFLEIKLIDARRVVVVICETLSRSYDRMKNAKISIDLTVPRCWCLYSWIISGLKESVCLTTTKKIVKRSNANKCCCLSAKWDRLISAWKQIGKRVCVCLCAMSPQGF